MKPLDFRMYCLPEQAPVDTSVHAEMGWSPSSSDNCWIVSASNVRGSQTSSVTTLSYPSDCISLPEPSGLLVGCLFLLAVCRRRR